MEFWHDIRKMVNALWLMQNMTKRTGSLLNDRCSMKKSYERFPTILKIVGLFTTGCGLTATGIAVMTALTPDISTVFLTPLFETVIYLFSAGVCAILGILSSQDSAGN